MSCSMHVIKGACIMLLFNQPQLQPNDVMCNLWYTTAENQDGDIPFTLMTCKAANAPTIYHYMIIPVHCHACLQMW